MKKQVIYFLWHFILSLFLMFTPDKDQTNPLK